MASNLDQPGREPAAAPDLKPSAMRLAIGTPVRDVARYLPRLIRVLEAVASACADVRIVFAENDSSDGTGDLVRSFVSTDPRCSLLQYPGLVGLVPERTDRIAFLRNSIVDLLVTQTSPDEEWTLVMLDADEVTSALTTDDVFRLAEFLQAHPEYSAATVNSHPVYYDIWTLRSEGWSPDDCWVQVNQRPPTVSWEEAVGMFVAARQVLIRADSPPVPVQSAFGGLGAYRLRDVVSCRYAGHLDTGEECSDHVPMNAQLTALTGKPLAIVPSVILKAPQEHVAETNLAATEGRSSVRSSVARARRTARRAASAGQRIGRLLASRSGLVRDPPASPVPCKVARVDEYCLRAGDDVPLPDDVGLFRASNSPIRSVGLALAQANRRSLRVIDVGAKIGDTALALVFGASADVLAIEVNPGFLGALRKNVAPLAGRITIADTRVTFAATHASNVDTQMFSDLLRELDWTDGHLLTTDTDAHGFDIISAALDAQWPLRPVLFFRFDAHLDSGGGVAGLSVIEDAIASGYRRWYVWDNCGNYLCQVDREHIVWFSLLAQYLLRCREAGGGLRHVDVSAFCDHHPPYDGRVGLRPRTGR